MRKEKSLELLINTFQNERLCRDDAKILAVKYAFEKGPREAMDYLETDDVLDFMNYKKSFDQNRKDYMKYMDLALFDVDIDSDKENYLNFLNERSKLANRLIATRIIDESENLDFDFIAYEEFSEPSIYDIAAINAKNDLEIMRSNGALLHGEKYIQKELYQRSISNAIYKTLSKNNEESIFEILGQEAYLELVSLRKKIDCGFYLELEDEARTFGYLGSEKGSKKYNRLKSLLEIKDSEHKNLLISEKLRTKFFPSSGIENYFLLNEKDDPFDEDEFDDD